MNINCFAQGTVIFNIQDVNGLPVQGSVINVLDKSYSKVIKSVLTDTLGMGDITSVDSVLFYQISNSNFHTHSPQLITLLRDTSVVITLVSKINNIEAVEIIQRAENAKLIHGGVSFVPDTTFYNKITPVVHYIKSMPGLNLSADGNLSYLGDNLTLYINGKPSNVSGQEALFVLQNISINDIDKIELLTTPGAKFSSKSGKIFNIITKKTNDLGVVISPSLGITTHDKYYLNNNLNIYKPKFQISNSILLNHSNYYQYEQHSLDDLSVETGNILDQEINVNNTPQNNLSIRNSVNVVLTKKLHVGVNLQGSWFKGNSTIEYLDNDVKSFVDHENTGRRYNLGSYLQYEFDKNQIVLEYSNINLNNESIMNTLNNVFSNNSSTSNQFLNLSHSFTIGEKLNVNWGGRYDKSIIDNSITFTDYNSEIKEDVLGGFGELTYSSGKVGVQLGIRNEFSKIRKNDAKLNAYNDFLPQLSIVFPMGKVNYMLSLKREISRPSFRSYLRFPTNINDNDQFVNLGNEDILPTYSNNIAIQRKQQIVGISTILNLSASLVKNSLISVPFFEGDRVYQITENLHSLNKLGADLILSKSYSNFKINFVPKFHFFDLKKTEFVSEYFEYFLPKRRWTVFSFNGNVDFKLFKKFNNNVSFNYISNQKNPFGYNRQNGSVNYSINTSFLKNTLFIGMDVKDIFNTSRFRNEERFGDYSRVSILKPETRMVYLYVTFRFGKVKKTESRRFNYSENNRVEEEIK